MLFSFSFVCLQQKMSGFSSSLHFCIPSSGTIQNCTCTVVVPSEQIPALQALLTSKYSFVSRPQTGIQKFSGNYNRPIFVSGTLSAKDTSRYLQYCAHRTLVLSKSIRCVDLVRVPRRAAIFLNFVPINQFQFFKTLILQKHNSNEILY